MGLFRPYQRTESATEQPTAVPAASVAPATPGGPAKKTVPTPTRREAEQARRERVHPILTPKEAKARERQAKAAQREEAMKTAEAAPGKALMRDFIDSRRGLSQYAMPMLMAVLVLSLVTTQFGTLVVALTSYLTWLVMLLIVIDIYLTWRGYKKLHAQRLPNEPLKGLLAYGLNRTINLRRLRLPAPRVKPGDKI